MHLLGINWRAGLKETSMSNAGHKQITKTLKKCPMSFAMCRREDVIKHRWNQMSVTGTEYILIISGQKVKLERKVAKIVFKMFACSVEIIQRLQVVFL